MHVLHPGRYPRRCFFPEASRKQSVSIFLDIVSTAHTREGVGMAKRFTINIEQIVATVPESKLILVPDEWWDETARVLIDKSKVRVFDRLYCWLAANHGYAKRGLHN